MRNTGTLQVTMKSDREVVLKRIFDAPRRMVFEAMTKPELLKRWMGPRGWELVVSEIELRGPNGSIPVNIVNGNIEVSFGGIPGETYSIEASQNLNPFITWTLVATNFVADANGLFKYVDTQARSLPMQFFRARTP